MSKLTGPQRQNGGRPKKVSTGLKNAPDLMPELTPEIIKKILDPIRIGSSVLTSFSLNGYSYATIRTWVLRGKAEPNSIYGELIRTIEKAVAEYEIRDLSVIDRHANGVPTEYEMEVARRKNGEPILNDGKPIMQIARDGNGNPIIKRSEIKSDWRAAMERLQRRLPRYWARPEVMTPGAIHPGDGIMGVEADRIPDEREAKTPEQLTRQALKRAEEDV